MANVREFSESLLNRYYGGSSSGGESACAVTGVGGGGADRTKLLAEQRDGGSSSGGESTVIGVGGDGASGDAITYGSYGIMYGTHCGVIRTVTYASWGEVPDWMKAAWPYRFRSEEPAPDTERGVAPPPKDGCECGGTASGCGSHSDWCPCSIESLPEAPEST